MIQLTSRDNVIKHLNNPHLTVINVKTRENRAISKLRILSIALITLFGNIIFKKVRDVKVKHLLRCDYFIFRLTK